MAGPEREGTLCPESEKVRTRDFIRTIIDEDIAAAKNRGKVVTRFPPEPNGYLHIGHAKSICLNFGIANEFSGVCNLRFDDTNPSKETQEYVDSIKELVTWLGFKWDRLTHASDFFDQLYDYAEDLIKTAKAYVCDLSQDQIRDYRGTLTVPGKDSPFRDRSVDENLELFRRMRAGEFAEGSKVLRAKIDMTSPNLNMRDPVIYRILKVSHQNTGDRWCIYPMYDYTHCINDALEGITHSLCTLEFEGHRPLYDWFLDQLDVPCHPRQIEFSRLSLYYTVMSKRLLNLLVSEKHVDGWDDPRMPTLAGIRRRGYTPEALRDFCERIGVTKKDNNIEISYLENCLREDLDRNTPRAFAVLRPLKVVITNYPEGKAEELIVPNHPYRPELGVRTIPFSRELYIEEDDFCEVPPKKFYRLSPGQEVRLRYAYVIRCNELIKDDRGQPIELRCSYDPATKSGASEGQRKIKGIIHWLSAAHARKALVRLYDRLFLVPEPTADKSVDFRTHLNPDSLEILNGCYLEPMLATADPETRFQFERLGYFCADRKDHRPDRPVYNRTVTLRDTWAKIKGALKERIQ